MSIARHHAEWLSLLEISGPFLSMPVLLRAFPQGLDALDTDLKRDLRAVYEEWLDNQRGLRPDPAIHRAWVEWVLRSVLEMPDEVIGDRVLGIGDSSLKVTLAEHGETLSPDFAIIEPHATRSTQHAARLLVQIAPPDQDLERPLRGSHWKASPATRMMTLLRATGVRLGLLTNGERWMLVDAPKDGTSGFISWYAELWLDEPLTLRALRSLLGVHRFFAVPDDETIEALLADSSDQQQEVTDQLGTQVRQAVELLVQAIDLADQDQGGALLAGLSETVLYEAALKVMMRLVFLLSAEERDLLPLDDAFYGENYAVSTLRASLREAADQLGEEVLERRYDAWYRLLAAFRAVHAGIQHDRLTLPAYGGGLFDPDALPFLEGRPPGTSWRKTQNVKRKTKNVKRNAQRAQHATNHSPLTTHHFPLPINNRTVLHVLDALQMLQIKVPGGGPAEARRISFRALDIEQIGHVYEGLLDHTARRATEPVLGLRGTKYREPETPLSELEGLREQGDKALLKFLREQTGRTASALRRGLDEGRETKDGQSRFLGPRSGAAGDTFDVSLLRAACGNDEDLYRRVLPFAGLLREDSYGRPIVVRAGSVYVTAGQARRATGTHYTPRSLTEPIVQHTLEPLVYRGPAQGLPRQEWTLHPAAALLDLKVCDMAMGSGAFLVQACRYLSERLVEAWEIAEGVKRKGVKRKKRVTVEGEAAEGADEAVPRDEVERLALARRLVADRCLYGVDKNPLAVEMAKLSLWLITMDKGRPFTFLDHALKCGDSLVGVSLEQLSYWDLDTGGTPALFAEGLRADVDKIIALRREIAATPVRDTRDQAHKAYLLGKAEAIAHDLRRGSDMLLASYYNDLRPTDQASLRQALLHAHRDGADVPPEWTEAADLDGLRPFHWQLEFPEVFLDEGRDGFDAFVGNPPFIGGRRVRETLGDRYRELLYALYSGSSGNADYCAFFFLRGFGRLQRGGTLGLIATNTIAQGDTRQTGLEKIVKEDGMIYNATNNQLWPGQAAVSVNVVHIVKGKIAPPFTLDAKSVQHISSSLDSRKVVGDPYSLAVNRAKSFIGYFVNGMGFVLSPKEAQTLIEKDLRNENVLFPYLSGQDLNTSPNQSPSRWVINFFDWPLEKAETYTEPMAIVREKVYPVRAKVRRKAHREYWWHYGDKRPALYEAIKPLSRVLITAQVSKYSLFAFHRNDIVFTHKIIVFPFEDVHWFAILQSDIHECWARTYSSTLETRMSYTPRDCFETFPFPQSPIPNLQSLTTIGETYHEHRRQIMLDRQEGLTKTYNRFHDPAEAASDIARLRELHVEMDQAVAAAYGWDPSAGSGQVLNLEHGFHETPQGVRYTISQEARWEVLDRLLALNHERYAEEVKAGLHEKKKRKGGRRASKREKKTDEKQPRLL